jgi:DNA-binding NtrC family response regulator
MPLNSREIPDPTRIVTVLLISPDAGDHILIRHVFDHSNWVLYHCRTIEDGLCFLREHELPVVISEERLAGADWKDVLRALDATARPAKLIVTAYGADSSLWAEVINLGGYDVLAKPWTERELYYTVSQAWLAWKQEAGRSSRPGDPPRCHRAAM